MNGNQKYKLIYKIMKRLKLFESYIDGKDIVRLTDIPKNLLGNKN